MMPRAGLVLLAPYLFHALDYDPADWRIEPAIHRIPIRVQQDSVGRLVLVERLLYADLAREVVAILDEEQAAASANIQVCGESRCSMVLDEDLSERDEAQSLGHAYVALEAVEVIGVDEELARKYRRFGKIADMSCPVTCEGCYHSNEVQLWRPVFQYLWQKTDFPTALLVGDADAGAFLEQAVDQGIPIEEVFAPLHPSAKATVQGALKAMAGRSKLDVLHVQPVSEGHSPCDSLLALVAHPWRKRPRLVSYLPPREVPPPFRARSQKDCSLGWLVMELSKYGYVLWKHTDRVTLFRPGAPSEAPDEVLCYAAYPLLESRHDPGSISRTRGWLSDAGEDAHATLRSIRSHLSQRDGHQQVEL